MPAAATAGHLDNHPDEDHQKHDGREVGKRELHLRYNQYAALRFREQQKTGFYGFAVVARAWP